MTRKSEILAGKKVLFVSSTEFSHRTREFREAMSLHNAGADVTVYGYSAEAPELWEKSPIKTEIFVPQTRGAIASENPIWFIRVSMNLTVNIVRRAIRSYTARKIEMLNFRKRGARFEPDIVHAMDLPSLKDATLIARASGAKLVYDSSEYWRGFVLNSVFENAQNDAIRLLRQEKKYIKQAKIVFTTSGTMHSQLSRDYGIANTVCLYNSPICKNTYPRPRPVGDTVKLVFHGSVGPDRSLDGLLIAMAEAPENISLDVYGGFVLNAEEECIRIVKEYGLEERVSFHGKYSYGDMLDFLPYYDVEFYPAQASDGNFDVTLPNKVFDCICSGIAMVVPSFKAMNELVACSGNGFTVDTNSNEAMVRALTWLSKNQAEIYKYKEVAHAMAPDFSWERQGEKLIAAYQELV